MWTLSFIAAQLAAGPMLILAWLRLRRLKDSHDPQQWLACMYLLALSLPILLFYLVVSFIANTQWNWTIAAYVPLCVLAAAAVPTAADRRSPGLATHAWRATLILGLALGLGALRLDLFARLPAVGKYIPIGRFTGADRMAAHVEQLSAELQAKATQLQGFPSDKPFIMAQHYGRAAQLAFYMQGHPTVYCSSSLLADGRLTPYDFWLQTDLRRNDHLIGRPAIVIGLTKEDWAPLFDSIEEVGTLDGDGKKNRPAFKAYNFRGFPPGGLRSPGAPVFQNP
jgi:hypothetical protein